MRFSPFRSVAMMFDSLHFTPFSALAGGALIGLAASVLVVANGRIAGISGLLGSLLERNDSAWGEKALFILGLLAAPVLWALFHEWPAIEFKTGPLGLIIAGLCVGIGTRYGSGCGISRLSPRSIVATLSFMFSGFVTVYILRHVLGF
jgi:uncharacterized membrane protein YedE/YeeE